MSRQPQTADAIRKAIHQLLILDDSLHGQLSSIPYFTIEPLPPGLRLEGANWQVQTLESGSQEMMAAIQRAAQRIQQEADMEVPFLGSSAFSPYQKG